MTDLSTTSDADLKALLLTVDGRGRAAKEAALTELIRRALLEAVHADDWARRYDGTGEGEQ